MMVGCRLTDLAHNWDKWRELVNAVMNIRFLHRAGIFLISLHPRQTLLHGVAETYVLKRQRRHHKS
jgi:hypothetical protein